MTTVAPSWNCPKCAAPLPAAASFCPSCGAATPQGIDRNRGALDAPPPPDESANRERLQAALGASCEIRRLLGRGGFAEVYVAYDRRLKREIAVKTLRGDLVVSSTLLDRFQREAEAVAMLRHPNVVPIYSVGEGEGIAYFTMPLIEGESLGAALEREGQFSVAETRRILHDAAGALAAAHRAGLVHRDVKPENILLEGPERRALLMDFGIARTGDGSLSALTGTGTLVGTPHYMSPEQAVGDRTLDHRSDQYSLALVGYRMLTGRFPFEADTLQGLIFKQVAEVPSPVREVRPDVPQELSDALARALAKRPDDRFESMAAFAAAIAPPLHHAHGGGDTQRAGRRPDDWATRVRTMHERMPRLRSATVALGALGLALYAAFAPRSVPATALDVAGQREEAVFTARAFLTARGVARDWSVYPELQRVDSVYRFLQRTVGRDSAERRAAADVPLWTWRVNLRASGAADHWHVFVGPASRVLGYSQALPDTAARPTLTREQARAVAEREVAARGWPPAALARLPDSTVTRRARTDHVFTWRKQADAVAWRGADSAELRVQVRVLGDQVGAYRQFLQLPESYSRAVRPNAAFDFVTAAAWLVALVLAGAAIALGIRRQRVDELQWASGARLVGVACLLMGGWLLWTIINELLAGDFGGDEAPPLIAVVIFMTLAGAMLVAGALFVFVAGESLANEQRPAMVSGLRDVATGRMLVPELPPAAAAGYAYALLLAGAVATIAVLTPRFLNTPASSEVSSTFSLGLPALWPLPTLGSAILVVIPCLFIVTFALRYRFPEPVTLLLPALVVGALYLGSDSMTVEQLLVRTVFTALLAVVLWRHGVVAGLVAAYVAMALPGVTQLLLSGNDDHLTAALLAALLVAAPGLLAIAAWRAAGRTPAGAAATAARAS